MVQDLQSQGGWVEGQIYYEVTFHNTYGLKQVNQ